MFTLEQLRTKLNAMAQHPTDKRKLSQPVRVRDLFKTPAEVIPVADIVLVGGLPMLLLGEWDEPDDNDEPNHEYHPGVDGPRVKGCGWEPDD